MDINDLRGISTAFLMITFIGMCFWAYNSKRKKHLMRPPTCHSRTRS